jgi:diguanylate cyclase (GGDEF)-like protein
VKKIGMVRVGSAGLPLAAPAALWFVVLRDGPDADAVLVAAALLTGLAVIRQIVAARRRSRLVGRLDDSARALRRSMARERVLGDLGTALLRARTVDEVHGLAVRAAGALLTDCPAVRAAIITPAPDDPDAFLVADAAGADAAAVAGRRLPAGAVPTELLVRLAGGAVISVPDLAGLAVGDTPAVTGADPAGLDRREHRPLTLLPLVYGERFFGVLSVRTGAELPADLRGPLDALRTQVSLALDSVALTDELTLRAMHDPLTGLANRALMRDRLTAALARAKRSGRPVGVLLLDLDGFKPINDTHGQDAGDEMLKVAADRLRAGVRTEDLVGRLGGDEFVVIAEDLRSAQDAVVIAERIVESLDQGVPYRRHRLRTSASLGIALSHSETTGPDELLRLADTAMRVAKGDGGGGRYYLHDGPCLQSG